MHLIWQQFENQCYILTHPPYCPLHAYQAAPPRLRSSPRRDPAGGSWPSPLDCVAGSDCAACALCGGPGVLCPHCPPVEKAHHGPHDVFALAEWPAACALGTGPCVLHVQHHSRVHPLLEQSAGNAGQSWSEVSRSGPARSGAPGGWSGIPMSGCCLSPRLHRLHPWSLQPRSGSRWTRWRSGAHAWAQGRGWKS